MEEYARKVDGTTTGTLDYEVPARPVYRHGICHCPGCDEQIDHKARFCVQHASWRRTDEYQSDWTEFAARLLVARMEQAMAESITVKVKDVVKLEDLAEYLELYGLEVVPHPEHKGKWPPAELEVRKREGPH